MLKVVAEAIEGQGRESLAGMDLDAVAREGARRMLVAALEAEVTEYVAKYRQERLLTRGAHSYGSPRFAGATLR